MTNVSFIVTIYNKSQFIPFVTDALFNQQDVGECEYIFVDDGSTDDSLAVLRACTQGRENVKIISQANAGPAIATNRGIAEASGSYLKLVDGDDILHPQATAELLDAIRKHGVEMAYCMIDEVPFKAGSFEIPNTPLADTPSRLIANPLDLIYEKALFNLTCVLASTEAVRAAGGCDPRVFIQDYSFALRMAARGDFACVPKVLSWAPTEIDRRASELGGGAQVLHDLNAALGFFVADHPELKRQTKGKILLRTTGRAWKWAKRVNGAATLSKPFWRYALARMLPFGGTVGRILATRETFRAQSEVRVPS